MDACLETGVDYLDTANYEPLDKAKFEYKWQWAYQSRYKKAGLMALLGSGFDPGVTNVYTAWLHKHEFDEIETLDIVDANAGSHGQPFATNFNPEINIREITEQDLAAVSAICIDAFITSVAGSLSAEGITTFTNIAACTAFQRRMAEDNLLLVVEYDGKVAGVVELKQGRHVAMLFVAPAWQKNGIGKQLLAAVLPNAASKIWHAGHNRHSLCID